MSNRHRNQVPGKVFKGVYLFVLRFYGPVNPIVSK